MTLSNFFIFLKHQYCCDKFLDTPPSPISVTTFMDEPIFVFSVGLRLQQPDVERNGHPGVNFINIFTYKFFLQTSFWQLFLVTFWLWQKIYTKKSRVKRWWNRRQCSELPALDMGGTSDPYIKVKLFRFENEQIKALNSKVCFDWWSINYR